MGASWADLSAVASGEAKALDGATAKIRQINKPVVNTVEDFISNYVDCVVGVWSW